MSNLEQLRETINQIDSQMAALFEERMQVSRAIGEYKKEHALPAKDESRESAVLGMVKDRIQNEEFEPYYIDFQKNVMEVSCSLQSRIINGMKVGYSGVPGAYAHIAASRLFPEAELIPFANFDPAFHAAENGEVDCAVLPFENSYAGDVGAVMDLMYSGGLYVNQVMTLEIEHNLLGIKGASIADVKMVVSHPQALSQCDSYIKQHGFDTLDYSNTARAAEYVKQMNDPTIAAIASEETARLFGLEVFERKINTARNNSSRFGVFSRAQSLTPRNAKGDSCGFILLFTVPNEAGSLAMILDIIGAHGFNMRNLKSRPMKDLMWNYYFYVEAEGNINSQEGEDLLREIRAVCGLVKVAGSFTN